MIQCILSDALARGAGAESALAHGVDHTLDSVCRAKIEFHRRTISLRHHTIHPRGCIRKPLCNTVSIRWVVQGQVTLGSFTSAAAMLLIEWQVRRILAGFGCFSSGCQPAGLLFWAFCSFSNVWSWAGQDCTLGNRLHGRVSLPSRSIVYIQ